MAGAGGQIKRCPNQTMQFGPYPIRRTPPCDQVRCVTGVQKKRPVLQKKMPTRRSDLLVLLFGRGVGGFGLCGLDGLNVFVAEGFHQLEQSLSHMRV